MADHKAICREISIAIWNLTSRSTLYEKTILNLLGINHSDLRALSELGRMGSMPAGQLADVLHITSGASTALIDRLERKGFVRRSKDAADRRRIMVMMTEPGRQKTFNLTGPLVEKIQTQLESYSPNDLQLIHGFLIKVNDLFMERVTQLEEESPR